MSQNDFLARLGQWVIRVDSLGERAYQLFKPTDPSKDYEVAKYYVSLAERGITFKPLIRVSSGDSVCVSCEG